MGTTDCSQLSLTELNDKTLFLHSFKCKKCGKLLSFPIRLVDGLGNICGKCDLEDQSKTTLHNTALEDILQNLTIPCHNKSRGCKERFEYFTVQQNLAMCTKRYCLCPFYILENCPYDDVFIFEHFYRNHREKILEVSYNNYVQISTHLKTTNDFVRILYIVNNQFIMHIKCDLQSSSLYCVMYYMGDPNNIENFSVTIEYIRKKNVIIQYKLNKIIPYNGNFSLDVDQENALKIDLCDLKEFVSDSIIKSLVKIKPKNIIDEELLAPFICQSCNNYMNPPVYQCLSGHSFCSHCKHKFTKCLTCRVNLEGNTRNYSLEALVNKNITFPCFYQNFGCPIIMSNTEINNHKLNCYYKPYRCPFAALKTCRWKGTRLNISNHLTDSHPDNTDFTNFIEVLTIPCIRSLFYNGDIFIVCFIYVKGIVKYYVRHIELNNKRNKYNFEIRSFNKWNKNRQTIIMDTCETFSNNKHTFMNFVEKSLSTQEDIKLFCKIIKTA